MKINIFHTTIDGERCTVMPIPEQTLGRLGISEISGVVSSTNYGIPHGKVLWVLADSDICQRLQAIDNRISFDPFAGHVKL